MERTSDEARPNGKDTLMNDPVNVAMAILTVFCLSFIGYKIWRERKDRGQRIERRYWREDEDG